MPPQSEPLSSYSSLPNSEIRVSHVPPSSPTPTSIILVTLYRPNNHNAFTDTMMRELESIFTLLSLDDRVRCVVLTGHGRMFCAGADLQRGFKGGEGMEEGSRGHRDGGGRVALAIHRCRKPVLAAIQGPAIGVGITMTLPCAIRVAHSSAKIGFVFPRRGLAPEACSSFFLPRLVGHGRALHLLTMGAVYRADDRLLEGLFGETVEVAERVVPRALELAEEVAGNVSLVGWEVGRDLLWRGPGSAEEAHLLESRVLYGLRRARDNEEGVRAFLEKRRPRFEGRIGRDAPEVWPWWAPVDTRAPGKGGEAKGVSKL